MRCVVDIEAKEITPSTEDILKQQGVPPGVALDEPTLTAAREAIALWEHLSQPVGIFMEIPIREFAQVYIGDGRNEPETPLPNIYQRADALALFAVTVGHDVEQEIRRLFETNEFPLGAMLDAAASVSAEKAVDVAQNKFQEYLGNGGRWGRSKGVMPFSPGYCGWHVSGQRALFDTLHPEEIGIALSDSYLMQPLKSISGVLVAGPKDIFQFDDDFPFCSECATRSCRERIMSIIENQPKADTR
ncbi:MAG: hypothetical protein KAW46_05265 [candidate division Zixibacteria bacterium]|nr:hypothetical protein [candidate division Zixibacteria bacterium]